MMHHKQTTNPIRHMSKIYVCKLKNQLFFTGSSREVVIIYIFRSLPFICLLVAFFYLNRDKKHVTSSRPGNGSTYPTQTSPHSLLVWLDFNQPTKQTNKNLIQICLQHLIRSKDIFENWLYCMLNIFYKGCITGIQKDIIPEFQNCYNDYKN